MVSTNTWYQYSLCVWATVAGIAAAVFETLSPLLNELKEDISCVKSEIANLSETVSHLAEEQEYHKNETASERVDLRSSVNSELANLGSFLQFMIDNPPTEAVRSAVLRWTPTDTQPADYICSRST